MLRRGLEPRRKALLERAPGGPYRDYLARPFPEPTRDARELAFLALDFETSGLDARVHEILSLGYVVVEGGRVRLDRATHVLVAAQQPVPEASAAVHGILDSHLCKGAALDDTLAQLFAGLAGKVLVAHFAALEQAFLDAACRAHFGLPFVAPVVDTLRLERRRLRQRGRPVAEESLKLAAVRERYNLPAYRNHHALSDALATAELFLAQLEHMAGDGPLPLKRLLV